MKKLLTTILFLFTATVYPREWTFEVNPSNIKMCSSKGLQRPSYFIDTCGAVNMINLSFFNSHTFIPPYKDSKVSVLSNRKKWPFLSISGGVPTMYDGKSLGQLNLNEIGINSSFVVSGFPLLIHDGKKTKVSKSFFSRRRCPRTVIGIHQNGSIILYVTSAATLKEVQNTLFSFGCTEALNLDGGSSTFLYLNGKKEFSSNKGKSYPNVLYWE